METLDELLKKGWGMSDYSPVFEAENIARAAAAGTRYGEFQQAPGETLWDYTLASFESTLEHYAPGESESGETGSNFSIFDVLDGNYPGLRVGVGWVEPGNRVPGENGRDFMGSIFLARETETGHDVLSYSLFDTPAGLDVERSAAEYGADIYAGTLFSALHPDSGVAPAALMNNLPGITNAEVFGAIGYVQQAAAYAQEAGPAEYAGGDATYAAAGSEAAGGGDGGGDSGGGGDAGGGSE